VRVFLRQSDLFGAFEITQEDRSILAAGDEKALSGVNAIERTASRNDFGSASAGRCFSTSQRTMRLLKSPTASRLPSGENASAPIAD
jgi:hypothetical protein